MRKSLSLPYKHEDLSLGSQFYRSPPEMTTQTQQKIFMPANWHSLGDSGPKYSLESTEHRVFEDKTKTKDHPGISLGGCRGHFTEASGLTEVKISS